MNIDCILYQNRILMKLLVYLNIQLPPESAKMIHFPVLPMIVGEVTVRVRGVSIIGEGEVEESVEVEVIIIN